MGVLYDGVDPNGPPADGNLYAGYKRGLYPSYQGLVSRFPDRPVLAIAVGADETDCDVLDVERGDATPDQVPGWLDRTVPPRLAVPMVYMSYSAWAACKQAAGPRQVCWWVADWTGGSHLLPGAAAVQWQSTDRYDVSETNDGLIVLRAAPNPPPPPPPPTTTFDLGGFAMQLHTDLIPVQSLDHQGHGWVVAPYPFGQVVDVTAQGPNPPADGYWPPVHVEYQEHADGTLVTLYGSPDQQCGVYVKHFAD